MISVIIPIYNAANYLQQTLVNLLSVCGESEVILVDDGSTDSSAEICNQYSRQDKRIRVIHQRNAGPAAARNTGLKNANGDWIYFMDADDELKNDGFEIFNSACKERDIDLHVFGFKVKWNNTENIIQFPERFINRSDFGKYIVNNVLGVAHGNGFLWNKLYRRNVIIANHLEFCCDARVQEDEMFNLMYLRHCSSIKLHNHIVYNYNISNLCNSRSRYIDNYFECIEQVHKIFEMVLDEFHTPIPQSLYYRTLHAVMVNELMYYTFHSDNHLSRQQRNDRLKKIGKSSIYNQSLVNVRSNSKLSFEWSCYNQAIKRGNIGILDLFRSFFTCLRHVKHAFHI